MIGDVVFVLLGLLHFAGCFGGFLAWGFLLWLYGSRRGAAVRAGLRDDEYRCRWCKASDYCDAAFTGVPYPCPDYTEKEDGL